MHKQVTCQLWDRDFEDEQRTGLAVRRSHDGKRRLVAPDWAGRPEDS